MLFVTHDMSLVSRFSDRLAIMYAGQLVELGATREVFENPRHPYTTGLLQAFPALRGPRRRILGIPGSPPDLRSPPSGCRFHPRCSHATDRCVSEPPAWHAPAARDVVLCHLYDPRSTVNGRQIV